MNRRELLHTGALTIGAAGLPLTVGAQGIGGGIDTATQVPPIWRKAMGGRIVTVVSDGYVPFEDWHSPNIAADARAELLAKAFLPTDIYQGSINTFVVDDGERGVALIDAGSGNLLGPTAGHLVANLRAAGYAPEDITTVLATHLHPDHVGGAHDGAGSPTFPNAEFVVGAIDHAFWTDGAVQAQAPEEARFLWTVASDALTAYRGRVRRFEGTADVLSGIAPVALPGHTPGHTGFVVSGGGEDLLIWADVIHFAPLQLPRPEVAFAFDIDPSLATTTRRRTLDMAASDRLLIAGMHMPFPGTGHIVREGDGYAFAASRWGYAL